MTDTPQCTDTPVAPEQPGPVRPAAMAPLVDEPPPVSPANSLEAVDAAGAGQPAGRPRRLVAVLAAVVVLLVAGAATGTVLVVHGHHPKSGGPVANQRPEKLPEAVPSAPATVTASDGSVLNCPTGAAPAIALGGSTFSPQLANGQLIGKGRYHITLTGIVQNETSSPIVIHSVTVFIDDQPWTPTITVAPGLAAQSSADLVIDGIYQSPRAGTPSIHTNLNWNWQSTDLIPCGDTGLIEDD